MLVFGLIVAGFVLGAIVGRWWALLAAAALATYIWTGNVLEVPGWYLALVSGAIAAASIAVGVWFRKLLRRPS